MSPVGKILIGINVLVFLYWLKVMWRNTPRRTGKKRKISKSYFNKIESARNFFGS